MGGTNYIGCCLAVVAVGCLAGLVYDVFGLIKTLTKNNLFVCIVADIVVCFLTGFGFICAIFTLSDGTFAFFECICLAFGVILEQIFVKNIFTSLNKLMYNRSTTPKREKK